MTSTTGLVGRVSNRPTKRHLRNYLLNPRFQLKYTAVLVGVAVGLMGALGAVIGWTASLAAQAASAAVQQSYEATTQAERAFRESQTSSRIVHMQQLAEAQDNPDLVQAITQQLTEADALAERNLAAVRRQRGQINAERVAIDHGRTRTFFTLIVAGLCFVLILGAAGIVITHKIVGPIFKLKRLLRLVGTGRLDIRDRLRRGDELEDLFEAFLGMVESLKNAQQVELAKIEEVIQGLDHADSDKTAAIAELRALQAQMLLALGSPPSTVPPPPSG